jgi:crotonobetainyl-CoA:carnitine CoA-transferase CaiB-like acyl-CoA transferase
VVEAASMVMVPSVGAALADYGAQVIKLEPIEGLGLAWPELQGINPRLGKHTAAILAEIGLNEQAIRSLAQRRVVADHETVPAPIPGPQ